MSGETEELSPEQIEQEARVMGWVPEDEFKGKKDQWVDAEEFLERGRHVMPILLQNNKRLTKELLQRDKKIGNLEASLASTQTAIEKLEKHYTEANKRAVETAKADLKSQLREARENDDVDAEERILGELGELQQRERDAARQPAKTEKREEPKKSDPPEVQQWYKDNPWFGGESKEDKAKTKAIVRIAEDLRDEGTDLMGVDFFEECVRVYEEQQEPPASKRPPANKVEGGNSRGKSNGGGKTFSSLPSEAKQACWDDVEDLVGEGKRYKTKKDWEDAYARIYYSED